MHNLAQIQAELHNAILGQESQLNFIKKNGSISAKDRLNVHIDTVLENLVNSLYISYPGIWKLIGDDCARGVSLAYIHSKGNIMSRATMSDFGANFPEFLSNFPSTKDLLYLKDYAHLEWLRSKSYASPKVKPVSQQDLQTATSNGIENYKIQFNDSVYFMLSEFPLMNIQNLLDDSSTDELDLSKADSFIVVCRVQNHVETLCLGAQQWKFLETINNNSTIGDAIEVFEEDSLESEITQIINLMIAKEMINRMIK